MSFLRSRPLTVPALAVILATLCAPAAWAEKTPAPESNDKVGIEEKLGATLPAGLVFKDEAGNDVELTKLIRRPTILTLVYFKCPSICGPLMNEVARTVDELPNIKPGEHFDLITVSIDPTETPDMATTGKAALLGRMETKVPEDSWHFLTGQEETIRRLANTVGFYYTRTEDGADFNHAGTVIFLSKDAKVMRYLSGLAMLPFDMEMAINDATEGRTRTLMQRIQKLCFKESPDGKGYTLAINRLVLIVTLLGVGIFGLFLFIKRKKASRNEPKTPSNPSVAGGATGGGTV
ncbi:MAG: SCO family protein [Planctomycetota bacterium]|nr:SCO family protein [Planctomycetota bacterium]